MGRDDYVALVASLPALGPMLAAKAAPISAPRLEQRLRALSPEHREELDAMRSLIVFPRSSTPEEDAAFLRRARRVIATLTSPSIGKFVRERLELRTLIAALRRRAAGEDAPRPDEDWGYGRFVRRMRENWREPGFGVDRAFPMVRPAREALDKGDSAALERIALEAAWKAADRIARRHAFDFEAVALYVARWHLLQRWTRYDADAAAARFSTLVDAALASAPADAMEALR
ncbi:MAG: hypothetical protein AAGI51_07750 [Pseudomonadota bacterium]